MRWRAAPRRRCECMRNDFGITIAEAAVAVAQWRGDGDIISSVGERLPAAAVQRFCFRKGPFSPIWPRARQMSQSILYRLGICTGRPCPAVPIRKKCQQNGNCWNIFPVNARNNPMPILVSPLICTKMSPGIRAWLLIVVGGRIAVGIDCDRIEWVVVISIVVRAVTGLCTNNIGSGH